MTQSFTSYLAVVEFLVKNLQQPIDVAIRDAQVPNYMIDQVKSYITGPVEILRPDLILAWPTACSPLRAFERQRPAALLHGIPRFSVE